MSRKDQSRVKRSANRVINPGDQSEAEARRAPWVLLAFFVLLIVVAVGVWALRVFWFEPSQESAPAPQPSATAESHATAATPEGARTCELDTRDRDISASPPEATRWVVDRWAVLPEVEGAGPCIEREGYRVGFAPTQTGAVLATYHYLVHGDYASPDSGTHGLLEYATADGPLKAGILQALADVENGVEPRVPDSELQGIEFRGYRIVSFDGDAAVIEVALTKQDAARSFTVKLLWQDNDWRIDPASDSVWGVPSRDIRLQNFVLWSINTEPRQ